MQKFQKIRFPFSNKFGVPWVPPFHGSHTSPNPLGFSLFLFILDLTFLDLTSVDLTYVELDLASTGLDLTLDGWSTPVPQGVRLMIRAFSFMTVSNDPSLTTSVYIIYR